MAMANLMNIYRQKQSLKMPEEDLGMEENRLFQGPYLGSGDGSQALQMPMAQEAAPSLEQLAQMQPGYAAQERELSPPLTEAERVALQPKQSSLGPAETAGIQAGASLVGGLMKSKAEGEAQLAKLKQEALRQQSEAEQSAMSQAGQSKQNALTKLISSYKSALF